MSSEREIYLAYVIATAAHGARGQKRADDTTPYITHPRRVAELVGHAWVGKGVHKDSRSVEVGMAAAWLHDVLEDTKLTARDLTELGISRETLDVVERLTKPSPVNAPATAEYYQGIAENDIACIVKAADRCANLEDALTEIQATRGLKRWARYVEKTTTDVLPIYKSLPFLRDQIQQRLDAITEALSGVAVS